MMSKSCRTVAGFAVFFCLGFSAVRAWIYDPGKPLIYEMRIAFETDKWINMYSTATVLSRSDNTVAFRVVANSTVTPTYQLVVTTQGNVGIGTAGPGYKLDVNGDVNVASGSGFKIGGTNLLDTDGTLAANSDTRVATQKAVKTYADKMIKGDGTAGRVLRVATLMIADGTNADTVKPSVTSRWNGDACSAEDNLGKGGDTGKFSLNADGSVLTWKSSAITGDAVVVLSAELFAYQSSTITLLPKVYASSGNITFYFIDGRTGQNVDITTITGALWQPAVEIVATYLTSE